MKFDTMDNFVKDHNLSCEKLNKLEVQGLYFLVKEIRYENFQYRSEI